LATVYRPIPVSRGGLRPQRSAAGPYTSCPAPKPSKNALSVSWTRLGLVAKLSARVGKAGRYMSMDSGPKAVSAPRTMVKPTAALPEGAAGGGAVPGGTLVVGMKALRAQQTGHPAECQGRAGPVESDRRGHRRGR